MVTKTKHKKYKHDTVLMKRYEHYKKRTFAYDQTTVTSRRLGAFQQKAAGTVTKGSIQYLSK